MLGGIYGPTSSVIFTGALFPWVHATVLHFYIDLAMNRSRRDIFRLSFQGAAVGLVAGISLTTWINVGQVNHFPHRSFLDTSTEDCTHLPGNYTGWPIPDDK